MYLSLARQRAWRAAKARLLLPIVYLRGFAMTGGEIEDTATDPFNGFNLGSTMLRTDWTGDAARHVFESPVLRLSQPPYNYRLAFSDGLRGLDPESRRDLADWLAEPGGEPDPARAVLAVYRYYDAASRSLGDGVRPGMEAYGWGLGRLVLDILDVTGAPGVYLVAHSMGGLVARTFLQNETVLDGSAPRQASRCTAVEALLSADESRRISQTDWQRARASVRRLFTYGTPHNGITGQGGFGNGLLGPVDALLGLEMNNFDRDRMRVYLDQPPEANSLAGRFPVRSTFCLVGTAAADYPVAGGFSRRLVGQLSDGLVEIDNAVVHGPADSGQPDLRPGDTVLAARAYIRRAHSGPYGMVNSEEGFGNLSRFLFGDARVDCDLHVRSLELPSDLAQRKAELDANHQDARIRASYSFETSLRVRGERWVLNERLAYSGSAIFRRYEELLPDKSISPELRARDGIDEQTSRHRRVDLFSAFLDTQLRTLDPAHPEIVEGLPLYGTLGFAFRLRVAVPDYQLDGSFWNKRHYEGSALLDKDLVFLAFEDAEHAWGLAWGPNSADGKNEQLHIVKDRIADPPGPLTSRTQAWRRQLNDGAIEFWLPLVSDQPPDFKAWLRLTARSWNA
ncbi:MAG: hypothetical protein J0H14_08105 [Alphaproteobacteria bacterium]|nr:hypothetical protein [Alphaproteobacteria bacterium]